MSEQNKRHVVDAGSILFIPEKSNSVKPLYKLQREAIKETRSFRRQDNRNQN